jgi:hypothetical protein
MEGLSSSKDLSIPQLQRRYGLPPITDRAHTTAQRWKALSLQHHEQALPTQQLANTAAVGTLAAADAAFQ